MAGIEEDDQILLLGFGDNPFKSGFDLFLGCLGIGYNSFIYAFKDPFSNLLEHVRYVSRVRSGIVEAVERLVVIFEPDRDNIEAENWLLCRIDGRAGKDIIAGIEGDGGN